MTAALFLLFLAADADRDSLDDKTEAKLLKQFRPEFLVDAHDCDGLPAEFKKGAATPTPGARNGTIYGQAFPLGANRIELHYYHLWTNDCGRGRHPLDAEHVAVLLENKKATYWIANGHDGTLCDRRHGAPAALLNATDKGARVWVSVGKHASFLSQKRCAGGCGADQCNHPVTMKDGPLINIGEAHHPAPGYEWIRVRQGSFHLPPKMETEFRSADLATLAGARDIIHLSPIPKPAQAFLRGGNTTGDALLTGQQHTESALATASTQVDEALAHAGGNVNSALATSAAHVKQSLKKAGRWLRR